MQAESGVARTVVYLNPTIRRWVQDEAREAGMSVSTFVRTIIVAFRNDSIGRPSDRVAARD